MALASSLLNHIVIFCVVLVVFFILHYHPDAILIFFLTGVITMFFVVQLPTS
jgi:hypothetical protein